MPVQVAITRDDAVTLVPFETSFPGRPVPSGRAFQLHAYVSESLVCFAASVVDHRHKSILVRGKRCRRRCAPACFALFKIHAFDQAIHDGMNVPYLAV